jgi:hypothetical protein
MVVFTVDFKGCNRTFLSVSPTICRCTKQVSRVTLRQQTIHPKKFSTLYSRIIFDLFRFLSLHFFPSHVKRPSENLKLSNSWSTSSLISTSMWRKYENLHAHSHAQQEKRSSPWAEGTSLRKAVPASPKGRKAPPEFQVLTINLGDYHNDKGTL